jgi:16S rRNA processing protein RimM
VAERVAVGRVGRPHGLAGAFVVEDASAAPERFQLGARLFVDGVGAEIVESKRAGGRPVIRLDRKATRGAALEVERAALPEPDLDHYYVFDLVGAEVLEEDGATLGVVADVAPGVANDVLELDSGLALPFVGACVREIDLDRRRILVARGFSTGG